MSAVAYSLPASVFRVVDRCTLKLDVRSLFMPTTAEWNGRMRSPTGADAGVRMTAADSGELTLPGPGAPGAARLHTVLGLLKDEHLPVPDDVRGDGPPRPDPQVRVRADFSRR
jgi:hypothetical protein